MQEKLIFITGYANICAIFGCHNILDNFAHFSLDLDFGLDRISEMSEFYTTSSQSARITAGYGAFSTTIT